jgi:hypothetical protein
MATPLTQDQALALVNRTIRASGVKGVPDAKRIELRDEVVRRSRAGATADQLAPLVTQAAKDFGASQEQKAKDASKSPIALSGVETKAAPTTTATDPNNPYGVSWGAAGQPTFMGGQAQPKQMSMSQGWQTLLQANLSAMPNPKDPAYKGDMAAYRADMQEWQTSTIAAQQNARLSQQLELGILEMPDGTLLDVSDPEVERNPQLKASLATFWHQQDQKVRNDYAAQLNALDLQEYAGVVSATNANNANLSRSFQDALSLVNERVSIGQANQDTAVKEIERILKGQQENRLRASDAETQLAAASGYAAPAGKTSFSANDLGAAQAGLAKLAGIAPDAPLLNFTGQRTVDPLGMLRGLDQQAGVDRALPEIPGLGVTAADLPNAPAYAGVGGPPTLRRPEAPIIPDRTAPAAPKGPSLLALQSVADGMAQ